MNENRSSFALPVIIIVGILIVAGAFYYQSKNPASGEPKGVIPAELSQLLPAAEGTNLDKFRPVDATDKVLGSANAPVKLVVYTDLECPACKYFHDEIGKIKSKYVTTGQMAIVYRDFPLDQLHSKARTESLAAECVNEAGGVEKYWQFIDKIFEITPSNNGLDLAKLGETAKDLGVDTKNFDACMKAEKYADKIQNSIDEAIALGVRGTPFFVLVTTDQKIPVFGGVPADRFSAALDILLGGRTQEIEMASTTVQ